MKIGPSVPAQLTSVPKDTRKSGAKDSATDDSGNGQVNLSDLSKTLSAMETNMSDKSVDSQRVEQIKEAIRNGDFKVNAHAVAQGLIDSVQTLISGSTPK